MLSLQNIKRLIDNNSLDAAMRSLNEYVAAEPSDDEAFFVRGKLKWRLQDYAAAVTDFEQAVALNPESRARHALELARDVFDFYNPDLLNP